jgi:heat shock protein HslJ
LSFEARPWVLSSGIPLPQDVAVVRPSATFESGTVSGSTGCNRYTGPYTLDGGAGQIASTMMACIPPADWIERAFLDALGKVAGWRSGGEQLVLVGHDDAELLRFAAATPVGTWQVTGIRRDASTSPLAGTDLTATFSPDGSLSGSAGCNAYKASYTTGKGTIAIQAPAATRKACADAAGVMEQETAYLALLPTAVSYRMDGNVLELLAGDGTQLVTYTRSA